jgi:hypothetical protein
MQLYLVLRLRVHYSSPALLAVCLSVNDQQISQQQGRYQENEALVR